MKSYIEMTYLEKLNNVFNCAGRTAFMPIDMTEKTNPNSPISMLVYGTAIVVTPLTMVVGGLEFVAGSALVSAEHISTVFGKFNARRLFKKWGKE